jgi:hypothetical protein
MFKRTVTINKFSPAVTPFIKQIIKACPSFPMGNKNEKYPQAENGLGDGKEYKGRSMALRFFRG